MDRETGDGRDAGAGQDEEGLRDGVKDGWMDRCTTGDGRSEDDGRDGAGKRQGRRMDG